MSKEVWKPVVGINKVRPDGTPKYSVSDRGRVRVNAWRDVYGKTHEERIMMPQKTVSGSRIVTLYVDRKVHCTTSVHILVAQAFLENPEQFKSVVHLDGDYENNCVENLKWGTRQDILETQPGYVKPPMKSVRQYALSGEFLNEFSSINEAAASLDKASISHIRSCCSGHRRDSAYGFQWRYSDDPEVTENNTLPPCHAERWKPIKQYTRDGAFVAEFPSSVVAAKTTGLRCEHIYKCCLGWRKWYSGYVWRFSDEAVVSRR